MFPGKKFAIGETEYTVPALSLGQLRSGALEMIREADALAKPEFVESKYFELVDARAKVVVLAIKRNYPDVDEKKLEESIDLANVNQLWLHVLGMSALLGEATAEGLAAKLLAAKANGTSAPSTAA